MIVTARRQLAVLAAPVLVCALHSTAWAQPPGAVRVVRSTTIVRWLPKVPSDVLATVEPGTRLEVLDKDEDWYWVVAPRDAHGSSRAGWIAVRDVEGVVEDAAAAPMPHVQEAAAAVSTSPTVETPRPQEAARMSAAPRETAAPPAPYTFDEVYFDRDRSSIKPEAVAGLDRAVARLMDDQRLALTIEGHTCSLGTAAYNRALGERRAVAVREYLVGRGVAANRLSTVSSGEERPAYDNSREETRRLNRRVVLVPRPAPGGADGSR